ncbi:uncharacterized protein J7T55_001531 [Diaporthe amygdali]|uniref:uncharacterized protein n=1 Tax=Phomopsis amygdali TaxID=1214568 RepID=UPI0022FE98B6|nr:uncharacterized protein J7T55_001531 [Diaporthe amygdali]KAJ0115122.1 uncharacterized protein J7T55_001531 [Diaporthe amygdali]
MSRLIVVVGATGGQGGSVVNAMLADPNYCIRGITRNLESEKAMELTAKGVEMVKADVGDEASLDAAFHGANAIFAITDYYETFFKHGKDAAMEAEFQAGCNLARAAARVTTLQRYLWSTLPFTSRLTGGEVIVPHFEGKARVDEYIRKSLPSLSEKATFCIFGIFADNLLMYPIFKPVWLESAGKWVQIWPTLPDAPFHSLADHKINTGIFVRAIVTADHLRGGSYVTCFVESLTLESALGIWGKATGKAPTHGSTAILSISYDQYVNVWGEMGEEQACQWKFFEFMNSAGVTALPDTVSGLSILSEDERKALENTEQSWFRLRDQL